MSLSMSGIMSLVVSLHNLGWSEHIISIWLSAWRFSFMVALPTVLILTPLMRRLVDSLTAQNS
ncbi:DUF2798 domain-containing protein [Bowmanella denitrificans]|uniref:DUF2798 domain-containing protein n=1 Tax=Bowmanella denitrificans TaxID=366582 RepID=UPI002481AA8A|nr:DUF2798 domain-containing protein [Bowmanella denitrificans]